MSTATASKTYRKIHKRPNPVKNPGPPNRKAKAKLDARVRDYGLMVADSKKNWDGYHRPGSMQGPR